MLKVQKYTEYHKILDTIQISSFKTFVIVSRRKFVQNKVLDESS